MFYTFIITVYFNVYATMLNHYIHTYIHLLTYLLTYLLTDICSKTHEYKQIADKWTEPTAIPSMYSMCLGTT